MAVVTHTVLMTQVAVVAHMATMVTAVAHMAAMMTAQLTSMSTDMAKVTHITSGRTNSIYAGLCPWWRFWSSIHVAVDHLFVSISIVGVVIIWKENSVFIRKLVLSL